MFEYLSEAKTKLVTEKLPYSHTDLEPVLSKKTLEYHYDEIGRAHV